MTLAVWSLCVLATIFFFHFSKLVMFREQYSQTQHTLTTTNSVCIDLGANKRHVPVLTIHQQSSLELFPQKLLGLPDTYVDFKCKHGILQNYKIFFLVSQLMLFDTQSLLSFVRMLLR